MKQLWAFIAILLSAMTIAEGVAYASCEEALTRSQLNLPKEAFLLRLENRYGQTPEALAVRKAIERELEKFGITIDRSSKKPTFLQKCLSLFSCPPEAPPPTRFKTKNIQGRLHSVITEDEVTGERTLRIKFIEIAMNDHNGRRIEDGEWEKDLNLNVAFGKMVAGVLATTEDQLKKDPKIKSVLVHIWVTVNPRLATTLKNMGFKVSKHGPILQYDESWRAELLLERRR